MMQQFNVIAIKFHYKLTWDSSHVLLMTEIDELFWTMDMKAFS
jgi:hypothetical protein